MPVVTRNITAGYDFGNVRKIETMSKTGNKSKTAPKGRILHVAPMPPAIGGMRTYFQGLLNSPTSRLFEFHVVSSDILNKFRYRGIKRKILNIFNCIAVALAVIWEIIIYRPHIVHTQTNSGSGFYEKSVMSLIGRIFLRKSVLHVHGGGFRNFYNRSSSLLKWAIRRCLFLNNSIIVASPQMRDTMLMIGVTEEKIKLIRNAINIPDESVWENSDHQNNGDVETTVLFLNRIEKAKGVMELIESAKTLCPEFPMLRFRIVGNESGDREEILKVISESGLNDRIEFVGRVSEEGKKKAFLNADIYVLPSHIEDLPYGLLEAMSYGLPCFASAVGGIPSLVEHQVNGLLGDPKDVEAIISSLRCLISDKKLRQEFGTKARQTVNDKFSWDHRAEEFRDVYNKLLPTAYQSTI